MCTGDQSADASSKSYALSAISCAGESFETAAVCNRALGFDILKMGGNTKIHVQKLRVHTCVYTTKKLMYQRYEKWGTHLWIYY